VDKTPWTEDPKMNLTKTWSVAVFLLGITLWAVQASADTEGWQDVWQEKTTSAPATPSDDWEHRALKQPQAPRPTTQRWVSPQRVAQRPSYDQNVAETIPLPDEPGTPIQKHVGRVDGAEVIEPGTTQFEAVPPGSVFEGGSAGQRRGCASCGHQGNEVAGDCGDCGQCDECGCQDGCDFGWEVFDGSCGPFLRGLSVFGGFDGFKGPLDRGGANGNFGMNEGINLARPLGDPWGCGYQIGANFVQSDFSGASVVTADGLSLNAPFRKQYFATAGLFRRAVCRGFQWGVAYDFLHDIYYQNANLQQVRSETGFVLDDTYEIGYYGAYGVGTDKDRVIDGKLDATDMFVLYIRRNFENGGDGRIWAGATGSGDGLLGADLWVPLGQGFALENRLNYMIPKQGRGDTAQTRESWGLLVQLVWYPGQNAKCQQKNPYRPIFNVADNSLFMVERLAR
jgi:hypothetical protein